MNQTVLTPPNLPIVPPRRRFLFHNQDAELLGHFVRFQFLRPSHAALLTGRNIVSVRRRLRQLHEQGLLQRLRFPVSLERGHYYTDRSAYRPEPQDQAVYLLSDKGVQRAKEFGLAEKTLRANEQKSLASLGHDLQVVNFHLALALACRQHKDLQLVHWEQRRSMLHEQFDQGTRSIDPDALFGLKSQTKPVWSGPHF